MIKNNEERDYKERGNTVIDLGKIEIEDYKEKKYTKLGNFYNGLACIRNEKYQYGYVNEEGIEVIPCIYEYAEDFSEGLGLVCKNGQYMFLDCTGTVKLELPYYRKVRSFHEGRAFVSRDQHECGFIDDKGIEIIPCQFDNASDFHEKLAVAAIRKKGFLGQTSSINCYIDEYGTVQRELMNKEISIQISSLFYGGIAPVNLGKDYIDKYGNLYSEEKEVEALTRLYQKKRFPKEEEKIIPEVLLGYCSKIFFLGRTVIVKADTKEELEQKKRELLIEINNAIDVFKTQNMSGLASEKSKQKTMVKKER